jgi:hypothetical protein
LTATPASSSPSLSPYSTAFTGLPSWTTSNHAKVKIKRLSTPWPPIQNSNLIFVYVWTGRILILIRTI